MKSVKQYTIMKIPTKLNYEHLLQEEEYSHWGTNKSIKENIVSKVNELIEFLETTQKEAKN